MCGQANPRTQHCTFQLQKDAQGDFPGFACSRLPHAPRIGEARAMEQATTIGVPISLLSQQGLLVWAVTRSGCLLAVHTRQTQDCVLQLFFYTGVYPGQQNMEHIQLIWGRFSTSSRVFLVAEQHVVGSQSEQQLSVVSSTTMQQELHASGVTGPDNGQEVFVWP